MSFRGIDVRETTDRLVFRNFLQDTAGALVTSGTTSLSLYELQSDGTLKSYDFNDNTFKSTALTTPTAAMTHRTGNNSTVNTGVFTYALTTLTGFTRGNVYFANVNNTGANPTDQMREFQFGDMEGDPIFINGSVNDGSATTTGFIGDSTLSSTDDFYNNEVLVFVSGTLKGLARKITDYTGSTKTFAFTVAFPSAPANSSLFQILGKID